MDANLKRIEGAIAHGLSCGRARIEDVAQILLISKSTLQRQMPSDVCFTDLRRKVQVRTALRSLCEGRLVATVAAEVCLSPDYLCVLVRKETGLTPGQIRRASRLGARLLRWKRGYPPEYGTPLYRRRVRDWRKVDTEMLDLLGDIRPGNPLFGWANELLRLSTKPDFRRQPHRDRLRARRRRESEHLQKRLRAFLEDRSRA